MSELDIQVTPGGYRAQVETLTLLAEKPIRDRGSIRVTLSIYNKDEHLLYRDNMNLTGDRSRSKVRKRLEEKTTDVPKQFDTALLALDEAIRQTPPVSQNGHKLTQRSRCCSV